VDPINVRAASAVRELVEEQANVFVTVAEVRAVMQRRWPNLFPRPPRSVTIWCREAVQAGHLIEDPDNEKEHRPNWDEMRFALPGDDASDGSPSMGRGAAAS
jgi:hypothetical protein